MPGHLSRRGQGTVSRLGPPIRKMAGSPRLMETRGAIRLISLWSVWPAGGGNSVNYKITR